MKKSPKIFNKQNEQMLQSRQRQQLSNPINDKMLKFGKSIRARLGQKNQQSTLRVIEPLQESQLYVNRQSANLQQNSKLVLDEDRMSVSFLINTEELNDTNGLSASSCWKSSLSKTKSVRFSKFQQGQSLSQSKAGRKNHSILKNSSSSSNISSNSVTSHVGSISGGSSIKSSLKDKGVDCQITKYESLLKVLTYQGKKYFDDMFPPGSASLFHSKSLTNSKKDIRWMRPEDIYRGQKLTLYSHEDRNLIKNADFEELSYMATCFNALGTSRKCLQKIFELQAYSRYGIYFLRLNHEGIWKYVIVDDFIPVRQVGKQCVPVFMTAQPIKSGYIQIWPLLLQKALAKMYSTYECLFNGETLDLMQQLTGVVPRQIRLNEQNSQTNYLQIKNHLLSNDCILVVSQSTGVDKKYCQSSYAIKEATKSPNTYFSSDTELSLMPTKSNCCTLSVSLQALHLHFNRLDVYQVSDGTFSVGCVIKQQYGSFSLRTFKIDSSSQGSHCVLTVSQKDKKYFRNNGYEYSWMRIILATKDIDGYRYIAASYAKQKTVSVECNLSPGQYFLLINGDWNNKKVYDVTLNYLGTVQVQLKRQPLASYPSLIPQVCRDLSQRFGKFVQINKNVCSYQYIDPQNGLIIEDFNNQLDRQVYFHRVYHRVWLKNCRSIGDAKFVNDFQQIQKQDQKRSNKYEVKYDKSDVNYQEAKHKFQQKPRDFEIDTFLEPDSNITMVLMTVGGLYQHQLSQFRFQ